MIIPHLLFAHFVGDYLLQTNWLVVRKSQGWDGLLLHGFIVFAMSVIALAPYTEQMALPLCVLFVLHTAQDWLKTWFALHIRIHLAWSYFADQFLHYAVIVGLQIWVGERVNPGDFEIWVMSLGAALIVVTRFFEVSWWANWFEMIVYMNHWQVWAYLERVCMLLLAMWGVIPMLLALLLGLPRLYWSLREGQPLWKEQYGIVEWTLGIALSVSVGYAVLNPLLEKIIS